MSEQAFKVTVEGEPVTAEVTWEQVRAWLRANGWAEGAEQFGVRIWTLNGNDATTPFRTVLVGALPEEDETDAICGAVRKIAFNRNAPAWQILREIAAMPIGAAGKAP